MNCTVVKADISGVTADAIVLPANPELKEGSGVSTAVFEAAGRKDLTKACHKIGHCDIGSAVPTLAFNLNAKYIIHAVVPRWIDGSNGEYDLLCSAYLSSLNIADVMGCKSIAFPLLASGNNGFDLELALVIALKCFESFKPINLQKIILVIYGTRITALMKEKGFAIAEIPGILRADELKQVHKEKQRQMKAEGKEVVHRFLEEQMQNAIDYLKDEKHREEILAAGIGLVKTAIKHAKKGKEM